MYKYDIFLSYRRKGPVLDWVDNHFLQLLKDWLNEADGFERDPEIFVDREEINPGMRWPAKLEDALKHSKILVCVWSPSYFRSPWCLAEWKSMQSREKLLGLGTPANPEGLVYPVKFNDGESFPQDAKQVQFRDLSRWNNSVKSFRDTPAYVGFEDEIKSIADQLSAMISKAPDWRPDFPVELPQPAAAAAHGLVRL